MQPCPSGCSGEGYSTGRWNPSQVPLVTWELCTVYLWHHALPGNVWPVQWVLQKRVASTLPGRSSCCHRPLGKVCEWKTAFHVCLHVRARFLLSFPLFPCNTSRRAMCTLSFHLRSFTHGFCNASIGCFWFYSAVWEHLSSYVVSCLPRFLAYFDCNHPCSLLLPSCSLPTTCIISSNNAALLQPTPP